MTDKRTTPSRTTRTTPSRRSLGLALALGLAVSPVAAQDTKPDLKPEAEPKKEGEPSGPKKDQDQETVALTRFMESFRTQDYVKAEEYFFALVKDYSTYKQRPEFLYRLAECQFKQNNPKKREEAATTIQTLLERESTHILGLFMLAKIRAMSDKPAQREEAKELLINAARNGLYVLKELKTDATFDQLKKNPQFILKAMKASQEFVAAPQLAKARNPFQTPWRLIAPDAGSGERTNRTVDLQRAQELETKITAIFEDIEKLAKESKIDELINKFSELNQLMAEFGGIGPTEAEKKLKQWDKRLEEYKEIRLAIKLQIYINSGNQYLQQMARAIQGEKFEEVFEKFSLLKSLVEKMKQEEREEFQRNAEALHVRGKTLDDEAHKLKKIKEFSLIVTGIVIDPRPDSRDRAIINSKIYEVGDPVTDNNDNEIPGLRVVKIHEGSVKFRYEDVEFFRELKSQQ